jgi:hypothetical protein
MTSATIVKPAAVPAPPSAPQVAVRHECGREQSEEGRRVGDGVRHAERCEVGGGAGHEDGDVNGYYGRFADIAVAECRAGNEGGC